MTDLLAELHHSLGLLYVTVVTMDEARKSWADRIGPAMTDAELMQAKFEPDEPILIVRALAGSPGAMRDADKEDLKLIANDSRGVPSNAKILELPPDEFFFFKAFRSGIADLTRDLPGFFHGMTLVHAWGLFEHYLGALLLRILGVRPQLLGRKRQINLGQVFCHQSKEALLESVATQDVRSLFYESIPVWLKALRKKYGLKELTKEYDGGLIETALIRNCLVHNRGVADSKLDRHTEGKYKQGEQIGISRESVLFATNTLRKFASAVDALALEIHLTSAATG